MFSISEVLFGCSSRLSLLTSLVFSTVPETRRTLGSVSGHQGFRESDSILSTAGSWLSCSLCVWGFFFYHEWPVGFSAEDPHLPGDVKADVTLGCGFPDPWADCGD